MPDVVTYAFVLETLNMEMINDWKFLEVYYEVCKKDPLRQSLTGFAAINAITIEEAIGRILEKFKANEIEPTYGKNISFNIFQAIVLDVQEKRLGNRNLHFVNSLNFTLLENR